MLILVVAVSMTMGASAASYIPDDVTYQNLNGQQLAIKTYTLLPDQDPADLYEEDFEHDGFLYSMSDIIKEEQHFQEENLHTEVVTVTTASKNLEDILAELKPTIEFDDGISSGTLSLDHSTIKTEAAGYKSSSYTVTATKNYTGLDRNDSSYIDKTVQYLSYLRFLSTDGQSRLAAFLETFDAAEYTLFQWNDAIEYLKAGVKQQTAQVARAQLLRALRTT